MGIRGIKYEKQVYSINFTQIMYLGFVKLNVHTLQSRDDMQSVSQAQFG